MQLTPDDKTALTHLYRGELSRMVAYRTRLDTTTNWTVVTSAGLITFSLGNAAVPHYVLLMAMFLILLFLVIEARRYRFYELIRQRVRLLEAGFYAEVLGKESMDWITPLHQSLLHPRLPISLLQALAVRLRNAYLGILLMVYLTWGLKHYLLGKSLLDSARIGVLPGWAVLSLLALIFLVLLGLAVFHSVPEED
ncbi:DUF2270 domain-containing protein [Meiothermus granaticius]|nr:DUF2270 domain-containing protein [Meiothermus granaticius]GEM86893.1 membrane protein [Meiothermus granaticius NBRC 107808]